MKEADRVRIQRARIARGLAKRKGWIDKVVKPNIEAIWGPDKPDWWPDDDPWVATPLIFAAMRAALPSLLFADPEFKTTPKRPIFLAEQEVSWQMSQGAALALNHAWRECDGKKHARVAIQNAMFSLGVLKSGYAPQFADDKDRGEFDLDDEGNFKIDQTTGDPMLAQGKFQTDEDNAVLRDEDGIPLLHPGKLLREEWYAESVDPRLMVFDPEGTNVFTTHRWVAEEWCRPLAEVKADTRFPAAVRRRIRATEILTFEEQREVLGDDEADDSVEEDRKRVRGYDIFDFAENRYMVLAAEPIDGWGEDQDRFLLNIQIPAGIEKHPYSFLKLNEKGFEWYPEPDVSGMAALQQEYREYRSMKRIHRSHARNRYCESENAFWGENADAQRALFTDGADGILIKARSDLLQPANKAPQDASFSQDGPEIRNDFDQAAIQGSEQRGIAGARSATQASLIQSNSEIASDDRRDNLVQTFLAEAGRKLFQAMQATMNADYYVRVDTPQAENPFEFMKMTPDMIAGEYDVDIRVGSTLAKNDPRSMMMLLQFFQAIAQNPWIGTIQGFIRRALDGMGLDASLTAEIIAAAEKAQAQQAKPAQRGGGGAADMGQQIQSMLTGGVGNEAGDAPTGAPMNAQIQ